MCSAPMRLAPPLMYVSSIKEAIVYRQALLAAEGEYTARTAMAEWARHCRNWTLQNL